MPTYLSYSRTRVQGLLVVVRSMPTEKGENVTASGRKQYKLCTPTQSTELYIYIYTHPDPTDCDIQARLGFRLLVGLGPGTRYIRAAL